MVLTDAQPRPEETDGLNGKCCAFTQSAVVLGKEKSMFSYPKVDSQTSRFFFFFPFCCKRNSEANAGGMAEAIISTPLSSLLKLPHLPSMLKDRKPKIDSEIWQPAKLNLSDDLHSHISLILGHSNQETKARIDHGAAGRPQRYELVSEARNVLTGEWGKLGMGLNIRLSASARRRLGVPSGKSVSIRVIIDAAYLQFFRSGIHILILECSYGCDADDLPFAEVILEANHHLCHAGKQAQSSLVWSDTSKNKIQSNRENNGEILADEPAFSLDDLARSLVTCGTPTIPRLLWPARINYLARSLVTCGAVGENSGQASLERQIDWMTKTRIFSYSAVQFKEAFSDEKARRLFAFRLCNKYTSDYSVREETYQCTLVPTFDNVLHGASLEGGCVVVEESGVSFLKNYASNSGRKVYLPLALVSFHEFRYLLGLIQESAIYVKRIIPSKEEIAQLRRLQHDLINFHLFFRFSHVSLISLHNMVHQAWREAFGLDRMLEEVTLDILEAEKVLSAEVVCHEERRWRVWGSVAIFMSIYFTISHVSEIWRKLLSEPPILPTILKVLNELMTVAEFEQIQRDILVKEMWLEAGAVFTAVAIAVFAYWRKP